MISFTALQSITLTLCSLHAQARSRSTLAGPVVAGALCARGELHHAGCTYLVVIEVPAAAPPAAVHAVPSFLTPTYDMVRAGLVRFKLLL